MADPATVTPFSSLSKTPETGPRTAAQPPGRRLSVGREIVLSGVIGSCDILEVEGTVKANISGCRELHIAKGGLFAGSAAVENVEVSGAFDGELSVNGRLFVREGGKVSGTVRYRQIEIERGGQIIGTVQNQA